MRLFAAQLHFFENLLGRAERFASTDEVLQTRWQRLQTQFFPERVDILDYEVRWSARVQKRVLGSCNLTHRRVRISRAMDRPELTHLLEALIHHEMCHAIVGAQLSARGRRIFHGRDFRVLERAHPEAMLLDEWIRAGGWQQAVRSYAATVRYQKRRLSR